MPNETPIHSHKEASDILGDSFEVEVTQADIDAGLLKDCANCPIALAIKRTLSAKGLDVLVSVYKTDFILSHRRRVNGDWSAYYFNFNLPYEAQMFIRYFDSGYRPQAPFTFTAVRDREYEKRENPNSDDVALLKSLGD